MKKFMVHKVVHGERFTFSSGHKVVGIKSINLVQAHKYSSSKTTSSLKRLRNSPGVNLRRSRSSGYRSLEDAEQKLEKNMKDSEDTGIQAAATGIKGIRTGNKVLWDTYRLGKAIIPKVSKVSNALSGSSARMYTVGSKIVTVNKGLVSGTIVIDKSTIIKIKSLTSQKVRNRALKATHTVKKPRLKNDVTVQKAVVSVGKVVSAGTSEASNILANNDDTGCQSVVAAKDFVKYGYRSISTISKGAYHAGNTIAKARKPSYQYPGRLKKDGYKLSSKTAYKKASKKATKSASKKVEKGIDKAFSSIKKKLVFNPITIVILIVIVVLSFTVIGVGTVAATVPGGVIESVSDVADGLKGIYEKVKDTISGVADWILGNDPDVELSDLSVEDYLLGAVALYREDVINRIFESQQEYIDSDYHVIKINNLYGAEARAELSAVDRDFIATSVIATEDIKDIIMPLFNSIMLGTYRGRASASEINSLTEDLNNMITDFKVLESSVEKCPGHIDTCLNPSETFYHTSDSGLDCCVSTTSYCPDDHLDGCTNLQKAEVPTFEMIDGELVQTGKIEIEFCGGHPDFHCNGYTECLGHNVVVFTLGNKKIDELMQVYFLDRIEELNNKSSLSDEEKNELINLEQNYQFALGLIEIYLD